MKLKNYSKKICEHSLEKWLVFFVLVVVGGGAARVVFGGKVEPSVASVPAGPAQLVATSTAPTTITGH